MKIPPIIKNRCDDIFNDFSGDIGKVIIKTTIAGWLASSAAQIIGIFRNKEYTQEEKSFMIPQEIGDAFVNIGAYYLITAPIKKLGSKLVKTGKILPALVKKTAIANNDELKLGNLNFDITKRPYFSERVEKEYNSFDNFVGTTATIIGGVLSSNIITPIIRNRFAAREQTKILNNINKYFHNNSETPKKSDTTNSYYNKVQAATPFNNMRHKTMSV